MDTILAHLPVEWHWGDVFSQDTQLWPAIVVMPFLTGVAVHLAVRPFEIDRHAFTLILTYALACAVCTATFHLQLTTTTTTTTTTGGPGPTPLAASLLQTLAVATSFNTGLFGSILVYRVFFHRLRRFPGPFLAKLSRFPALSYAARTKQAHLSTHRAHEKYGDFVRVGPREIAIFRPSAIPLIYGPASKCSRGPSYDNPSHKPEESSIVGTRDKAIHKLRKKAWDRGLGFRALNAYESRVSSKVDMFMTRLASSEGKPVDVTELCGWLGFDIMGDIGFSKDFRLLASGKEHPAVNGVREQTAYIGVLGTTPWLFRAIVTTINLLGKAGLQLSFQAFLDWCSAELEARRKAIKIEKEEKSTNDPQDVVSWLIKAADEGDGSVPPGEGAFQEDSRVLVVAGSDTTSAALTNALYYLAKHPDVYTKLQRELDAALPRGEADWTYTRLRDVPYLDHVIHETLRLKPSVPSGLPRITPPGGIQVDEVRIPGDVVVSVPPHSIHRDPRIWGDDALAFRPERWTAEGVHPDRMPFIPFTRGQYVCPGKNLAMMELRMALSRIALQYRRLAFAVPEDVTRFDEGALDTFTMTLPPLPLVLTKK